jgi:hypothetical protein
VNLENLFPPHLQKHEREKVAITNRRNIEEEEQHQRKAKIIISHELQRLNKFWVVF